MLVVWDLTVAHDLGFDIPDFLPLEHNRNYRGGRYIEIIGEQRDLYRAGEQLV